MSVLLRLLPKQSMAGKADRQTPDMLLTLCEMYNITDVLTVFGYTKDDSFFHVTPSERALIESYRNHPELQSAVNKLLDLSVVRKKPPVKKSSSQDA